MNDPRVSSGQPDFRALFEAAPGLYLVLTPELKIVAVSEAYLRATMTERRAILGRHLFEVFPDNPDDPAATGVRNLRASLRRVLVERVPHTMALQRYDIRKPESDGGALEARYWRPLNVPVFGPDGKVAYIIHRIEDVTEFVRLKQAGAEPDKQTQELRTRGGQMEAEIPPRAREAEEAKRRRELAQPEAARSINQRIFDTSLDLILVVDRRGNFIRISPSCVAILGYAPEEMVGRSAADFIHPDDLEATREEMRHARRGQLLRNFDCRYMHRDGHEVPLSWTGVWAAPEEQHFFIGRDMSDRIKLEQQLRQSQKMEAIGQLTGGIAHDFNNILSVIIGMSELLRDMVAKDTKLAPIVAAIDEAAERGAQLTQRMLAFARKQPLQARVVDLNETVTRMASVLQRTLGEDVAVSTVPSPNLWRASVDPSQVEDAILNLALNARDAMPRGGQLEIQTANVRLDEEYAAQNIDAVPGDYVAVVVTDSGTGMEPEVADRAFEPFFTTKDVGVGTGLGLSMVYGFVKQSRGHIKIYSEVGHGTSVKIYLPRAAEPGSEAADSAATVQPRARGREIILVVEDATAVRNMAVGILESLGYQVQQAEDGPSALEILRKPGPIDLLFTDMIMPNGMSGMDLLRKAREHRPDLKALFTSGYSEHFIEGRGNGDRSVPLLSKPYRRDKLAEAIRNVLDQDK